MKPVAPFGKAPVPRPFERVLAEATRAIAGDPELRVLFGPSGPRLEGDRILLPPTPEHPSPEALTLARGQADRLALRHAHHDPQLHGRHRPTGYRARMLFDALEDARCLSLGARDLAGVNANLAAVLGDELRRSNVLRGPGDNSEAMSQALALLVRERLAGLPIPQEALPLVARWQPHFEKRLATRLPRLLACAQDQQAFALEQQGVLQALGFAHELVTPPAPPARSTKPATAPTSDQPTPRLRADGGSVQEAREIAEEDEPDIEPQRPTAEMRSPKNKKTARRPRRRHPPAAG